MAMISIGGRQGRRHGNAGWEFDRAKPQRLRLKVLQLVGKKYSGEVGERLGPTLAAEHLAEEDGLQVDAETVRRWMLAEELWTRQVWRKPYCQRREAKARFGELVQMDRSFHDWFERGGPRGCLIKMVNATGAMLAWIANGRRSADGAGRA